MSLFDPKPTKDADAEEAIRDIEVMLEDDRYAFASDTLTGIFDSISRTGRCSEGQRRAIDNIQDSVRDRD